MNIGDILKGAATGFVAGGPVGAGVGALSGLFAKNESREPVSAAQGMQQVLLPEQQQILSKLTPMYENWLSSKPQIQNQPYQQAKVTMGGDKMSYQPATFGMASSMAMPTSHITTPPGISATPIAMTRGAAEMNAQRNVIPSRLPPDSKDYNFNTIPDTGSKGFNLAWKQTQDNINQQQLAKYPANDPYSSFLIPGQSQNLSGVSTKSSEGTADTSIGNAPTAIQGVTSNAFGYQPGTLNIADIPEYKSYSPEFGTYQAKTPEQVALEKAAEQRIFENLNRNPKDYLQAIYDLGITPLRESRDEAMQMADIEANRRGILASSQPMAQKYGAGDSINTRYMKGVGDLENRMVIANEALRQQALMDAYNLSGRQQGRDDQYARENESNRQYWTQFQSRQKEYDDAIKRKDWDTATRLGQWLAQREDDLAALNIDRDLSMQMKNIDLARLPMQDAQSFLYGLNPTATRAYDASLTDARTKQAQAQASNQGITDLLSQLGGYYDDYILRNTPASY